MIKLNTPEWSTFIERLSLIKNKSNREVLCIKCWQMLNCKQKLKHLRKNPDHRQFLLTSTQYASEEKIYELAQGYDKLIKKVDGAQYIISPFVPLNKALIEEMTASAVNLNPKGDEPSTGNQTQLLRNGPGQKENCDNSSALSKDAAKSDTNQEIMKFLENRVAVEIGQKRGQPNYSSCQDTPDINDVAQPGATKRQKSAGSNDQMTNLQEQLDCVVKQQGEMNKKINSVFEVLEIMIKQQLANTIATDVNGGSDKSFHSRTPQFVKEDLTPRFLNHQATTQEDNSASPNNFHQQGSVMNHKSQANALLSSLSQAMPNAGMGQQIKNLMELNMKVQQQQGRPPLSGSTARTNSESPTLHEQLLRNQAGTTLNAISAMQNKQTALLNNFSGDKLKQLSQSLMQSMRGQLGGAQFSKSPQLPSKQMVMQAQNTQKEQEEMFKKPSRMASARISPQLPLLAHYASNYPLPQAGSDLSDRA